MYCFVLCVGSCLPVHEDRTLQCGTHLRFESLRLGLSNYYMFDVKRLLTVWITMLFGAEGYIYLAATTKAVVGDAVVY